MNRRSFLKDLGGLAGALIGGRLVADIPVAPAVEVAPQIAPLLTADEIRKSVYELPPVDWMCSGWGGPTSEADKAREEFFGYYEDDEDDY